MHGMLKSRFIWLTARICAQASMKIKVAQLFACGVCLLSQGVRVLCLDDDPVSVETAYVNEDGSGWFYSIAEGNGALYASDRRQHCIRRFDSVAGVWQTWVGRCSPESAGFQNGAKHSAKFRQPGSMCINAAGHLILADAGNFCLRAITPEGKVSTYAGVCDTAGYADGHADEAMFSAISDVKCLQNCSVLVAEPSSGRIRLVVDSSSKCPAAQGHKTAYWLSHHKFWAVLGPTLTFAALLAAVFVWVNARAAQLRVRLLDRSQESAELCQDSAQGSRSTGMRDTGSTETAFQGMQEQQSVFGRLAAFCIQLWPATRYVHLPTAADAADCECGQHPQDLVETSHLASQDAAEALTAKQAGRGQHDRPVGESSQQSTSASDDVFNLFEAPDEVQYTATHSESLPAAAGQTRRYGSS